jgi:hypothetical protein
MKNIKRTDTHRPSVIIPSEYEFVAHECIKLETFGDAAFINTERERLRLHMEKTGGTYAGHEHGGNCMVCGAWAVYTNLFYHEKTNSYVRLGGDCTENMWADDFGMKRFRKNAADARKNQKGKNKAIALLGDRGLERCWELAIADWDESFKWEERTIRDIVDKLVRYGSLSDKQFDFLGGLLGKIDGRAEAEAKKAEEKATAKDAPEGRQTVDVEVVSVRAQDSDYGVTYKMLVKSVDGWKAWGTQPSSCPAVGDTIKLCATFTPAPDDSKFAFFKRPTVK